MAGSRGLYNATRKFSPSFWWHSSLWFGLILSFLKWLSHLLQLEDNATNSLMYIVVTCRSGRISKYLSWWFQKKSTLIRCPPLNQSLQPQGRVLCQSWVWQFKLFQATTNPTEHKSPVIPCGIIDEKHLRSTYCFQIRSSAWWVQPWVLALPAYIGRCHCHHPGDTDGSTRHMHLGDSSNWQKHLGGFPSINLLIIQKTIRICYFPCLSFLHSSPKSNERIWNVSDNRISCAQF